MSTSGWKKDNTIYQCCLLFIIVSVIKIQYSALGVFPLCFSHHYKTCKYTHIQIFFKKKKEKLALYWRGKDHEVTGTHRRADPVLRVWGEEKQSRIHRLGKQTSNDENAIKKEYSG